MAAETGVGSSASSASSVLPHFRRRRRANLDRHDVLAVLDNYRTEMPDMAYKSIAEALARLPAEPEKSTIEYICTVVGTAIPVPRPHAIEQDARMPQSKSDYTKRRTVEMPLREFLREIASQPEHQTETWLSYWQDAVELGEQDGMLPKTFVDVQSSFPKLWRGHLQYDLHVLAARTVTVLKIT